MHNLVSKELELFIYIEERHDPCNRVSELTRNTLCFVGLSVKDSTFKVTLLGNLSGFEVHNFSCMIKSRPLFTVTTT